MQKNKRILICPLDWGLGHAVRCVPIIRALQEKNITVIIAADHSPLKLLQKEFPELDFIQFPGVPISYPAEGESMLWSMLKQSPALLKGIKEENKFIEKTIRGLDIDCVISDNRFGAYSPSVPSVYITHQIHIQTGNKITDALARKQHAHYMKNFDAVWIPDIEGANAVSGKLAHGKNIPPHAQYIGILSRFSDMPNFEKTYDAAFILSGPEPQRSILEEIILKQSEEFPEKNFLLVRGKTDDLKILHKNVKIISLADAKTIRDIYASSEKIVCRSGYTSIMEMLSLNRSAWLIPTPGQTEQEYLAKYLHGKFGFKSVLQNEFSLRKILEENRQSSDGLFENILPTALNSAIDKLLDTKKG